MDYKVLILGGILCMCVSCVRETNSERKQAPLKVHTEVVTSQANSVASRYVGVIEPVHETPLSMQTSGRVMTVGVVNGEQVTKGQIILELESTQAMNALQGAEATLKHAQDGYDRAKQVHEKGVITDQKMVEIESQLTQAQSVYDAAKQHLNECTLRAPCSGVIDGLKVEYGQTIVPGTKLCSVLDVSAFCVRFTVPEKEMPELKSAGNKLRGDVECAAIDSVFPIVVTQKSVAGNPVTHTYDVVARIQGGADVLMTGMVAKVKLKGKKSDTVNDIIIPARCVLLKPSGHTVWLMKQGRAVRQDITVDGYRAGGVRVLSGLNEGDTLIVDGYQKLYNDCKVIAD
jgi:RND family efflux transporter MFP subunit